jgi:hypothetical protein
MNESKQEMRGFIQRRVCPAGIPQRRDRKKDSQGEMTVFMDGFKKKVKGGTLEFGIKVPPIP